MSKGAQRESVATAMPPHRWSQTSQTAWKPKNWKTAHKSNAISSHDYVEYCYVRL